MNGTDVQTLTSSPVAFPPTPPLFASRGEGDYVFDLEGRRLLDFNMLKHPLGHASAVQVRSLLEQASRLWDADELISDAQIRVAEMLDRLLPPGLQKISFHASGSEAVEAAMIIARGAVSPRRKRVLTFGGAYHGWTLGCRLAYTAAAGGRASPTWLVPVSVSFPRCRSNALGVWEGESASASLDALERSLAADSSIGICLIEPIQMTAGLLIPPPGYWEAARAIMKRHELLVISDEISAGGWRTRGLLSSPELEPDIVLLGKTLAGGLGASILAMSLPIHAKTIERPVCRSNALAAAVMAATLSELLRDDFRARLAAVTVALPKLLVTLPRSERQPSYLRVCGMSAALDFAYEGVSPEAADSLAAILQSKAAERGVRLPRSGGAVLLLPALSIGPEALSTGIEVIADVLDAPLR